MYLEKVEELSYYISKRYPEPTGRLEVNKAKLKSYQWYLANEILLRLHDNISQDPIDVIDNMLLATEKTLTMVTTIESKFLYSLKRSILENMKNYLKGD